MHADTFLVYAFSGKNGIINIEREVELSGSTHSKGVLILTGYLGEMFAQDMPLSLTASLCFEQLYNGVALGIDDDELINGAGVSKQDLYMCQAPSEEEMEKLDPIYISYFVPWNSFENYEFAKRHGFHDLTHEWNRTHHVENFDQVDSRAYLVHSWMKYPKFGHQTATDYAARMVRYGLATRDEAIELVKKTDHNLDPLCVRDFCDFCGYSETEFWSIVDSMYNKDIFVKDPVRGWKLKEEIK